MKKIILSLALAILTLAFFPVASAGAISEKPPVTIPAPKPADEAEARVLISRLNEINSMDKRKLNSSEKRNLRKEVKSIRTRLKDISGGVYISGAALVVIIVILIILV